MMAPSGCSAADQPARDDMGGEGLLDDGGALDAVRGPQRLPPPNRPVRSRAALPDAAAARHRRPGGREGRLLLRPVEPADGGGAEGDDLHRLALRRVGEAGAVRGMEACEQRGQLRRLGPGHQQLEGLAAVAQVGRDLHRAARLLHPVLLQAGQRLPAQRRDLGGDGLHVRRVGRQDAGAGEVLGEVGEQDAIGRERPRLPREDHLRDAELVRHLRRVQPARAAEGEKREEARIEPFSNRESARRRPTGRW
jgi:hypothetical protein